MINSQSNTRELCIVEAFNNNDVPMLNKLLATTMYKLTKKDINGLSLSFNIDTLFKVSNLLIVDEIELIMEHWYMNSNHKISEIAAITNEFGPIIAYGIDMCVRHECYESLEVFINKFPHADYYKYVNTPSCNISERCQRMISLHIIDKLTKLIGRHE